MSKNAVQMMLTKDAHDHVLPFAPLMPNAKQSPLARGKK
jgi:antitoxin component of RelBE/YafQ-DinJ toxin-antitoxin module